MKIKAILKKCLWIMLVIFLSFLMVRAGKNASENIRLEGEPALSCYGALLWEILRKIAVFVPAWLLSLLGLARSFLGENWFPVAGKIPVSVTKILLAVSVISLVGVTVGGAVYLEFGEISLWDYYAVEERFAGWQTMFAWSSFFSLMLYVDQWSIRRNCSRQDIRKRQRWVSVTIFLIWLILVEFRCVALWYIPLGQVGDLNSLEDYGLGWFSLFGAASLLPLLFFSARKTIRLFKNDDRWLMLTDIIPVKCTVLIAAVSMGLMIWQIQEARADRARIASFEVPEYLEAAATGHTFQALLWGLALFYALCLLLRQLRAARRKKREQEHEVKK